MERSLLVAITHGLATALVLKVLSFLLPTCLIGYFTDLAHLLLCLYVAKATLPLSKKKFLSQRIPPENKAVLITGCDSGFGNFLAKRLDANGYHVFASCLNPSSDGADSLRQSCSKRLQVFGLDVTKDDSVKEALNYVKDNLGTSELWAVVNNAGIYRGTNVELSKLDDFTQQLDVNTLGVVRVTKAFLPLLRQSKGRVVNLTSIAGRVILTHITPYTMSKFAARAFTECLKQEMEPWGVKAITVEPELFQTPLVLTSSQVIEDSWKHLDDNIKADYGEKYFKGCKASAEFLASFSSRKIHLVIDDLEKAISLEQPDAIYKPCRNNLMKVGFFFLENLPQIVGDLVVKTYCSIFKYPIPKEAENSL